MRPKAVWIVAGLLLCANFASAQDLTGNWQGTLGAAPRQLRILLRVEKGDGAPWKATFASIDQSPDWGAAPAPVEDLTVQGPSFKFAIAAIRGTYDGTIASDGNSIAGTWNQGRPLPLTFVRATSETAWKDPSPHTVRFVTAEPNVKLEVLDWGGPSSPSQSLVLVPGLGNTAHVFDALAPKLAAHYRVIGVTRRGFGASSAPTSGYAADRLGDDVLAAMQALSISRPVLVGAFSWRRRAEFHRIPIPRQGGWSDLS